MKGDGDGSSSVRMNDGYTISPSRSKPEVQKQLLFLRL